MTELEKLDRELVEGTVIERLNRFVLRVQFNEHVDDVHLSDPGALVGLVNSGATVLCAEATGAHRSTRYDAIAVDVAGAYVSLRPAFANELFAAAVESECLPQFLGYEIDVREPNLPDHGRTDFKLISPVGGDVLVEVKSCTHVDEGVAKFPDRQSQRARRHVQALIDLAEQGTESHVVFVIQRADAVGFQPYRAIDAAFADALRSARNSGVGIHAMATSFKPPSYYLEASSVPVEMAT